MRTKLKLVLVLASLGALAALALSSTASAGVTAAAADPMTTNVPYVAWAGEEVRLVKCIPDAAHGMTGVDAEWNIVDSSVRQRSGDLRDPVFFDDLDRRTAGFAGAGERANDTCWAIDVDSVNPGMTRIKMALDNGGPDGLPVVKHDFLVIWLNMSAPVLTELSSAAFPGLAVGDPLGDGNFVPRRRRLRERPDPGAGHGFVHRPARNRSDASRGLGCSGRLVRVRHERLQPERVGHPR